MDVGTVALTVGAFALGVLAGYVVGRPRRRRRSSVELAGNGAPRGRRGRHRGGQ